MLTDSKKVADRLENLSWYFEINKDRFDSLEDAFLAGYKKALEDAIDIMKNIKMGQNYN